MSHQQASCAVCGKIPASSRCSKCKTTSYCSKECQRSDWKVHKTTCKLSEGSPCDTCKIADYNTRPITNCCFECGHLFCDGCGEPYIERNSRGNIKRFLPCPSCGGASALDFSKQRNWKKLEALFDEQTHDPRRAEWMLQLAAVRGDHGASLETVKDIFLRAADLGSGEAYSRIAQLYVPRKDWANVKRYFEKAAARDHKVGLYNLAIEAHKGYFDFGLFVPQENRIATDDEKAFKLMKRAAQLGSAEACSGLAAFYLNGIGCTPNYEEHLKWARRGAGRN